MNGLAGVLDRINAASGVLRVRSDDAARFEMNGGSVELRRRFAVLLERLERIADELEDALA
jgi:hypothetical protein